MGCNLTHPTDGQDDMEVVIILNDVSNRIVMKDVRKNGKSVKRVVFNLPVITVTDEDNHETVVYTPQLIDKKTDKTDDSPTTDSEK